MTAQSVTDVKIGIVGMGRIGERVTRMLRSLGAENIVYWNRTRKDELESELGIKYVSPEELFSTCDVISNHLSSQAGQLITKDLLQKTKEGILFINTGSDAAFDTDALYEELKSKNSRAAFDDEIEDKRFKDLPVSIWFCSNSGTAYNTQAANKKASDMAVKSLLNILKTGEDEYLVNPEYKK